MPATVRSLLLAVMLALATWPVAAATMKEAIEQVQRETGGKVLSAGKIRTKVLMPDGRVRIFQIPA